MTPFVDSIHDDTSSTASVVPDDASSSVSVSDSASCGQEPWEMESVDSGLPSNSQGNPNDLAENLKTVALETNHEMEPLEVDDTTVYIDADVGDDELLDW